MKQSPSMSKALHTFFSDLMTDNKVERFPHLVTDNARSHGDDPNNHQCFDRRPPTPSNSFHKRGLGPARWDDSFEISEKSPTSAVSPNSVVSLHKLVSPRRRSSLTTGTSGHLRKLHDTISRPNGGTTSPFFPSLPLDDGVEEVQ